MGVFQKKCGVCDGCREGRAKCKAGTWYVDYYVNGRRRRETAPNKAMAEDLLSKRKIQIKENKYFDIRKESRLTFRELSEKYLKHCELTGKKSWKSTDVGNMEHLVDYFGAMLVSEISSEDVEVYKQKRLKDVKISKRRKIEMHVKPSTINHELSCMRTAINKAIYEWRDPENKRLPLFAGPNPAARFKRLREISRDRFLTKGELIKLLEVSDPELRQYILVAVNTGMRKGEMQGMTPAAVKLDLNYIFLPETKNGETRYVPTNETVKSILRGSFDFSYNPRKAFATALGRAEIKGLRFHDLRHTFASYLAHLGVDLYTISVLLGHKTKGGVYSITARYTHLQQDHLLTAVKKLDTYLSDVLPGYREGTYNEGRGGFKTKEPGTVWAVKYRQLPSKMDTFWTPGRKRKSLTTLFN
ncbi:MAG: site-specific integrase [Candidatus Omnitrophota bacterium]